MRIAPDARAALSVLRVALEVTWGLGFQAARAEVKREQLDRWQVAPNSSG